MSYAIQNLCTYNMYREVYELTRNEAWKVFHGDVEYYQRLGNVKVPLP